MQWQMHFAIATTTTTIREFDGNETGLLYIYFRYIRFRRNSSCFSIRALLASRLHRSKESSRGIETIRDAITSIHLEILDWRSFISLSQPSEHYWWLYYSIHSLWAKLLVYRSEVFLVIIVEFTSHLSCTHHHKIDLMRFHPIPVEKCTEKKICPATVPFVNIKHPNKLWYQW